MSPADDGSKASGAESGGEGVGSLLMYQALAPWWPLLSPVADYAEEAEFFLACLRARGMASGGDLLELGAGGGNNAGYLAPAFSHVTLVDLSPHMLAHAKARLPAADCRVADMRTVRLGRTFDVVFVHDAIDYMCTEADLAALFDTVATHCRPGGLVLLAPDHVMETFEPYTAHGGSDGPDRSLRYLEWARYGPRPKDGAPANTCEVDMTYVLREADQPPRVLHDTHVYGLFPRAHWLAGLRAVGLSATIIKDPFERELFLAQKRHDTGSEGPTESSPTAQ